MEAQEGEWDAIDAMVRSVPAHDAGAARRAGAGGDRHQRADAGWRLEMALHAIGRAGRGRDVHGARRGRCRPDPGRLRHQGDAGARHQQRPRSAGRPPAVRAEGVRDDRLREGVDQRGRMRARSATCATATASDEPQRAASPTRRSCWRASPRLRAPAMRHGDSRRRHAGRWRLLKLGVHLAHRAGRIGDHDATHRPQARVDPRRRRRAACDATCPKRTCSISSARRS